MKKNITNILCAALCIIAFLPACKKTESTTPEATQIINVGALLSLTGNWSSLGITSKAAIEIALEDINEYLKDNGSKYRFAVSVFDTKLDTALAVQHMATAKGKGITFILGPQSSAEAAAVKSFADANNMLVVSQGSTAGSLSIPNDNLFRFCPADDVEGPAMARTIYNAGVRGLVTIARNDAGNKGLQTSTGAAFSTLGGTISALTPYDQATTDFSSVIAGIKNAITTFTASYGTTGTAVYLASFDECAALFRQAASDPVLSSVNWYGGDGVVLSAALINDAAAAAFAVSTNFIAPTFGLPEETRSRWQPLSNAIKSRTVIDPDAFALAAYDAMWVIAMTYNAGSGSVPGFSSLKTTFRQHADTYYGVTGSTRLNDAGDRAAGTFDYWGIVSEGGAYIWKFRSRSE